MTPNEYWFSVLTTTRNLSIQWQILRRWFPFSLQGSRIIFLDNIRAQDNPCLLNSDAFFLSFSPIFYQRMIIPAYFILASSVLSTGPSVVLEVTLEMSLQGREYYAFYFSYEDGTHGGLNNLPKVTQ